MAETPTEPWTAERLEGVLTAAVYEHFINATDASFTFSAHGRDETYELLDPEDGEGGDVLTFERLDGVRFEVEFWANVIEVKP